MIDATEEARKIVQAVRNSMSGGREQIRIIAELVQFKRDNSPPEMTVGQKLVNTHNEEPEKLAAAIDAHLEKLNNGK